MHDRSKSYSEAPLTINSYLYQNFDSIQGIAHIQAVSHNLGLLKKRNSEEFTGAILKGVGRDFDIERFRTNIIEGEFIEFKNDTVEVIEGDTIKKLQWSDQILVSKKIADKLELETGDKIYMFFMKHDVLIRPLTVKGIYETGLEEFDELMIIGDIRLNQSLNKWADTLVGGYEIFVKDYDKLDQTYEEVFDAMDPDMQIENIRDKYIQIFDWLTLLDRNVVIFLFLILFVACFNMISILFIMIMERTNMIGMLKALGASNKQIQTIFFYNGIQLIIKGLLIGNLIALGFCALQYYFNIIPLDPQNYYMSTVPVEWNWLAFAALNILTFILVGLVMIVPIMVISNIKPIKAIKFD
jgi:lipoprotein-releasing system permease protein